MLLLVVSERCVSGINPNFASVGGDTIGRPFANNEISKYCMYCIQFDRNQPFCKTWNKPQLIARKVRGKIIYLVVDKIQVYRIYFFTCENVYNKG